MLPLFVTLQSYVASARNRLSREETGATAVEYGLIIGLIAVAIIVTLVTLGPQIAGMFTSLSTEIDQIPATGASTAPTTP
ncbi:Flp family type IVb pilin [Planctomonas deserti]|uniref:Flp family type IVb pilin n=1 Tax=Planctomonas deserti TaxID=2144185 RepID=UPI000D36E16D|nr:Flp family type IVb pilin [Planctomonas deserti]